MKHVKLNLVIALFGFLFFAWSSVPVRAQSDTSLSAGTPTTGISTTVTVTKKPVKKITKRKALPKKKAVEEVVEAPVEETVVTQVEQTPPVVAAETVKPVEDTATEELENSVIQSMLKNDFPEKTAFIAKEDQKVQTQLGAKPLPVLKATTRTEDAEPGMGAMFMKMLFTTLVLGSVVIVLALLWKWLQGRSGRLFAGGQKGLKILSQQVIGPKSRILIVEALGKKYLIGATESQIHLLADMDFYENQAETGQAQEAVSSMPSQSPVSRDAKMFEEQVASTPFSVPPSSAVLSPPDDKQVKASDRIKERLKSLKKLA